MTSLIPSMAALAAGVTAGVAAGAGAGCQIHPDLTDLYRVPPAPTAHPVYDPEAHFDQEQTAQGEEPEQKHGEKHGETGKQNNREDNKTNP